MGSARVGCSNLLGYTNSEPPGRVCVGVDQLSGK